ncbi:MAG: hypothetical protein M1818_006340 [Claussenomyces sp. TS43310]|nr:MAG: hypothetical protein M1818_006340 [Claussenomyces sp. TS43310]
MSAAAYTSGSSWSWPIRDFSTTSNGEGPAYTEGLPIPGSFVTEKQQPTPEQAKETSHEQGSQPRPRRQYHSPRTCRICLEVVLPTFAPAEDGLSGMLHPNPRVSYVSQDPESGRLIRPCKCTGSQRYVHEGCLQAWRHADPAYGRRNFWECPTCKFRYRLERMRVSRWISSTLAQIVLTTLILFLTVFLLGFVADPIISLYLDPVGTITTNPLTASPEVASILEFEDATWAEHILKGVASLGLLGFVRVFFVMSPWQWFNLRNSGMIGGGVRNGRNATGRDRLESISWSLVIIGIGTFLWAVWKGVRAWSRRALEKAGERVADVQGDDDIGDDDVEIEEPEPGAATGAHAG